MATGHEKYGDRGGSVADQTKTPIEHHLAKLPQLDPTVNRPVAIFAARAARQHPRSVNDKRAARDGHAAQRAGGSDIVAAPINSRVMGWRPSKPKRRMTTARSLLFSTASTCTRSDNVVSSSTLKSGMRLIS
jgi:hypothetical protein